MNKKLKPCPFCGGEVEAKHYELRTHNAKGKEIISIYFDIRCAGCGVRVEKVDREELVAKWNTRTPEIVRCGECTWFNKTSVNTGFCGFKGDRTHKDNFCNFGEMRTE